MSDRDDQKKQKGQQGKNERPNYFDFSELLGYFFRRRDPSKPRNFNIRAMHTINRIAILMFLFAVIFIIVRTILRSM